MTAKFGDFTYKEIIVRFKMIEDYGLKENNANVFYCFASHSFACSILSNATTFLPVNLTCAAIWDRYGESSGPAYPPG